MRTDRGLFRIAGENTDAIDGYEPGKGESALAEGVFSEQSVWAALKTCFDPEIPINIVDLGLVYDLAIESTATGGQRVEVKMTLTAPGCPASAYMGADVKRKIEQLPGVKEANVAVVWEPPWTPEMMSETAKKQFGWGL